jgi:hypothetical protein
MSSSYVNNGRFSLGCRATTPVTQGNKINMHAQFDRETAKKLESELYIFLMRGEIKTPISDINPKSNSKEEGR